MRVLQINLHHSKTASANLLIHLAKGGEDVVLIQEPWVLDNRICGIRTSNYSLFYRADEGRPRSCILVKKTYNAFFMSNFSDEDTVVVSVELQSGSLWLISAYMAHDSEIPPPVLRNILTEARQTGIGVVVGADANAHHTIWGSTDTNQRGESLFEFICNDNIVICNRGEEPTFITKNRREVLDLTLTSLTEDSIKGWKVLKEHSFSDHRYIEFKISIGDEPESSYRNYRTTDWTLFKDKFDNYLNEPPPRMVDSACVESAVGKLTKAYNLALEDSCPLKKEHAKIKPSWWSDDIQCLRTSCRGLFNKAKQTDLDEDWDIYKTSLSIYKAEIKKSKRASWRAFCESVEGCSETARFRKVLSKTSPPIGYIKLTNGSWALNSDESLDALLESHFPPGEEEATESPQANQTEGNLLAMDIVNQEKLVWAVNNFEPYKSPGLDGIIPAQLQKTLDSASSWLIAIFRACIQMGYIPCGWKRIRVVFIPKAGKRSHTTVKDFRPISLSSFLLKTLERLLELYVRNKIPRNMLSNSQHAYMKGKSVDTALYSLVNQVEGALTQKEFALVTFLDIEGAFNYVLPSAIVRALSNLGTADNIVRLIHRLLTERTVVATWGSTIKSRRVMRGTPQGGVLSPLLWLVVINDLLNTLDLGGCRVTAYADDVALLVRGKHLDTLSELMQSYLTDISRWAIRCGLAVNSSKTELVLFTRKHRIPEFRTPQLDGTSLVVSESVKYLGLILDRKLNWGPNLDERVKKAEVALYCCKQAIGKRWGLSPRAVLWIFTAIVRPILLYGCTFWWKAVEKISIARKLDRIQRIALVGTTGALGSTPTLALNVILNLLPPDIAAKRSAMISSLRLRETGIRGRNSNLPLPAVISNIPETTDYCVPMVNLEKPFQIFIPLREDWSGGFNVDEGHLNFFTDGSKLDNKVGGGVFCPDLNLEKSFRLPDHCSVFQAEMIAIGKVFSWLRNNVVTYTKVNIFTDSQAAIKSLNSSTVNSKTVRKCLTSLLVMSEFFQFRIIWVPGHSDIPGNCVADELARKGTALQAPCHMESAYMPFATCRLMIDQWANKLLQDRWENTNTCNKARQTWPLVSQKRTEELLKLPKYRLSVLIGILTGHCLIGPHARRLRVTAFDFCRSCQDEEEEETPQHLLLCCPAFARQRFKFLGGYSLHSLSEIGRIDPMSISSFIESTKWFKK